VAPRQFAHEQVCRVADLRGDPAALGGAVTVALCGHWEHEGDCRWPHHTSSRPDGDEVVATVRFDAPDDEVPEVRRLVGQALARGELVGPEGDLATWRLLPPSG
jgi:hypothetical protein